MMDAVRYISYLGISFLLLSCTPEPVFVEIDQLEPRVVVFSQVIPQEVTTILLTSTFGGLEYNEEEGDSLTDGFLNNLLVTGAEVTVSYRNVTERLEEVQPGSGVYVSGDTPQFPNEEYRLDVVTADGRILSATNLMLPQIGFTRVEPVLVKRTTDTLVTVEFEISDPPGDNRYMINYFLPRVPLTGGISALNGANGNRKKTVLIDDAAFTDGVFTGVTELPEFLPTDTLVVTLSNISEPYYRFLQARESADNFLSLLTREPVSSPTNVVGGLGFFNTHFPEIRTYNLREF